MKSFKQYLREYNPDEPRISKGHEGGGRWTKLGSGFQPDPKLNKIDSIEELKSMIEEVRKEIKVPKHIEVNYEENDRTFELEGHTYNYAGSCNIGKYNTPVTFYTNQILHGMAKEHVYQLIVHEFMHARFQSFLNKYEDENAQITSLSKLRDDTFWKTVMKPSGELREPYDKQWPIYNEYQRIMYWGDDWNSDDWANSDGVTKYSHEWWNAWWKGEATTQIAYHETLAEMAALKFRQRKNYNPNHIWSGRTTRNQYKNYNPETGTEEIIKKEMGKTEKDKLMLKGKTKWKELYDLVMKYGWEGNPDD